MRTPSVLGPLELYFHHVQLYFKKTQEIYVQADKAKATFKQYYLLLQEIENRKFSSAKLQEKQQIIQSEKLQASVIFKQFSKMN